MANCNVTCAADCIDLNLGTFSRESVYRLRFTIYKDGVLWTGIDSVVITFTGPAGQTVTGNGTLETPDAGVWYYDTLVTDFDSEDDIGIWIVDLKVTDGAIIQYYNGEISMVIV